MTHGNHDGAVSPSIEIPTSHLVNQSDITVPSYKVSTAQYKPFPTGTKPFPSSPIQAQKQTQKPLEYILDVTSVRLPDSDKPNHSDAPNLSNAHASDKPDLGKDPELMMLEGNWIQVTGRKATRKLHKAFYTTRATQSPVACSLMYQGGVQTSKQI